MAEQKWWEKGQVVFVIIGLVVILALFAFIVVGASDIFYNTSYEASNVKKLVDGTVATGTFIGGGFVGVLSWIVGPVLVSVGGQQLGTASSIIVGVSIWLLFFITFGDIIANFSSFSTWVAWIVAFAIATIAAQLEVLIIVTATIIGLFAGLGTLAVFAGLGAAFFFFIVVNLGLHKFGARFMRQRSMIAGQRSISESKVAGAELGSVAGMIGEIGDKLGGRS